MAKPLSPKMQDRLRKAYECAHREKAVGLTPHAIIHHLVSGHNGLHGYRNGTYKLRVAGVETTNTAGTADLMLTTWLRKAAAVLGVPHA